MSATADELERDSTDDATLEDDPVNATMLEDVTSFAELEIDSGTGAVEKLDEEAGMAAIEDTGTFKVVSGMTEAFSSVQAIKPIAEPTMAQAKTDFIKFFIINIPRSKIFNLSVNIYFFKSATNFLFSINKKEPANGFFFNV